MKEASILFLRACLALLVLPIRILAAVGLWQPFCRRLFFPFFFTRFSAAYEREAKGLKQELFRSLPAFRSPSGDLKLLELGTGPGVNFQFYPPGCRVTCSDSNPGFQRSLLRSMARNQHVRYERVLVAAGEDLRPVPSASQDAVVCTLVLCSVPDGSRVLGEALRVLREGGAFYFLEHVAADPCSWKHFWQRVWHPTWKLLFDGCCLTKETWKALEEADFSELHLQHTTVALPWTPTHPHIMGYAVK
ncbi:N6-adenosine-methyltransferase TMT1A-like [Pezoporus wallicus]|uniref:N6-adenosine-methyltransferase TMT1A-like n=1 Tax=Pezoporus wallicus TaxID=35540 RepID=UPI00254AB2BC|nr:N6-adenosine-methyltransferase TMT1A-like [Pezoporus wallicus]XP_061299305.1 N6-adenosine-methyltransferase TMT1A [Pezoporus flaviventris]